MRVLVNNLEIKKPREGDRWLMAEFIKIGFTERELIRLNRVRLHQQVLFLSDVLCAKGKYLDKKYLKKRRGNENWTTLTRFPTEKPPARDFKLWRQALTTVAPQGRMIDSVRGFVAEGHKRWEWRYRAEDDMLLRVTPERVIPHPHTLLPRHTNTPNRYTENIGNSNIDVTNLGNVATVREVAKDVWSIQSHAPQAAMPPSPTDFREVLLDWEHTWLWQDFRLVGDPNWIAEAIKDNSLVAVTDGSYIKEIYPNLCSAAYILECKHGRGKLIGSMPEQSLAACAYRGELLGLLAIHLILLSVNKVHPSLSGSAVIYSDCLGALGRVKDLPPYRIPTRCKHSDILKTILVNCSELTFAREFKHVAAHQDDEQSFHKLSRPSQLNCACDAGAKKQILSRAENELPKQEPFPLEPVSMYVGDEKMTSDTSDHIRFVAHRQLAKEVYYSLGILFPEQFEEVAWKYVHMTLYDVPRLFQVWACKQVMGIAGTFHFQSQYNDEIDPKCRSCGQCDETAAHILHCNEMGRVDTLLKTINNMKEWLEEVDTDPGLAFCLVDYARRRGGMVMEDVCRNMPRRYHRMAISQDMISWRRFMEGMISKEVITIQQQYLATIGSRLSIDKWAKGLITKLLEVSHGQWLYRNVVVHDRVTGDAATRRKEEIQMEIEKQQELGENGLLQEDKFLMEVNLDDLETTSGEREEYWLLAIRAAREACALRAQRPTTTEATESFGDGH